MILSYSEINGKDINEVAFIAYPNTPIYADYKVDKVENKVISIPKTGVYVF